MLLFDFLLGRNRGSTFSGPLPKNGSPILCIQNEDQILGEINKVYQKVRKFTIRSSVNICLHVPRSLTQGSAVAPEIKYTRDSTWLKTLANLAGFGST
jgi:hypothetical protein